MKKLVDVNAGEKITITFSRLPTGAAEEFVGEQIVGALRVSGYAERPRDLVFSEVPAPTPGYLTVVIASRFLYEPFKQRLFAEYVSRWFREVFLHQEIGDFLVEVVVCNVLRDGGGVHESRAVVTTIDRAAIKKYGPTHRRTAIVA